MCLFSSNDGIWSNEGCVRSEGNMTYSVCLCNHLTNFAILMQVVPLKVRVLAALLLLCRPKCSCLNGSQQPVVFSSALGNLQGSTKQCWNCFALACKRNGVNYQLVNTVITYSFKNKHLWKCAYFVPAAAYYCPFLKPCTTVVAFLCRELHNSSGFTSLWTVILAEDRIFKHMWLQNI